MTQTNVLVLTWEKALHALQRDLMAPSQPQDGPFTCNIAEVR
jgi:hypothetical protein